MSSPNKRGAVTKEEKIVVLLDKVAENLLEERPEGSDAWKNVLETLYEHHPTYSAQMEKKRLTIQKEKLEKILQGARKALAS